MRRLAGPGLLLAGLLLGASAAPAQTESLVLAKNLSGHVTPTSLDVSLSPVGSCDEAAALLPEGSRLVSDWFALELDAKGRGTFRGGGALLDPSGSPVAHVLLHGTIGVPGGAAADCSGAGRIDGTLEPAPTVSAAAPFREATAIREARFTLDLVPNAAGPTPLYTGRLDGLLSPGPDVPPPSYVRIAPDRPFYGTSDVITAVVMNGSAAAITVRDGETFCTIVRLEKLERAGWQLVNGCPLASLPHPVTIAAGETRRVPLPPDGGGAPSWDAGLYRLTLAYGRSDAATKERPGVSSAPFAVGPTPPPSAGLAISTSRDGYRAGEPIVAFLENDTDTKFVLTDHHSYCTVLTLERLRLDGSWELTQPCLIATPSRPVELGPRQRLVVQLPPGSDVARHEAGVYRLSTEATGPDGASVHVESGRVMVFAVRSDGPDRR